MTRNYQERGRMVVNKKAKLGDIMKILIDPRVKDITRKEQGNRLK